MDQKNVRQDHITSGVRTWLEIPQVYIYFQNLVGAKNMWKKLVNNYFSTKSNDFVLDLGCGPAEILSYLPKNISYDGFDLNERYIKYAQNKYKDRGKFYCKRISEIQDLQNKKYNIVSASAILHHLSDLEATQLLSLSQQALVEGGYLITIDPVYHKGQNPISRFIISKDRGQHVRDAEGYEALARKYFDNIEVHVIKGWTRVMPYTLCIMKCYKNR